MVQATGNGVGFLEWLMATIAICGLFKIGGALCEIGEAFGTIAEEVSDLRRLAEEMDDE